MIIELNIGLLSPAGPNTPAALAARESVVRQFLVENTKVLQITPFEAVYAATGDADGADTREPTIYAKVLYGGVFPSQTIYRLAVLTGQDCIAAYFPDTGAGRLIGPRSEAWGEFNPAFFTRFN